MQLIIIKRIIEIMKELYTLLRKVKDFTTKLNRVLLNKHIKKLYNSLKKIEVVRYITHDSCAISVVPPFNRL